MRPDCPSGRELLILVRLLAAIFPRDAARVCRLFGVNRERVTVLLLSILALLALLEPAWLVALHRSPSLVGIARIPLTGTSQTEPRSWRDYIRSPGGG